MIEPDEQFTIKLHRNPAQGWNFVVEPAVITVTILNDDSPGVVRCIDGSTREGNSGTKDVTITCVSPTPISGTIDYATADGTATAGKRLRQDERHHHLCGRNVKSFTVPIFGDKEIEPDEHFTVNLTAHPSERQPFTMVRDSVDVTITNDDEPPPRTALVLAPPRLTEVVGDTSQIRVTIVPPFEKPTTLVIIAQDPSIVDVPQGAVIAPGQPTAITITAKKRGTTAITFTAGEATAVLSVDVIEGSPSLTSLEPAIGTNVGGGPVTIHGANLSSGCVAWFGTAQASLATATTTTATVVAPPHAAGTIDVALSCGSAKAMLPQAFTYIATRGRAARH